MQLRDRRLIVLPAIKRGEAQKIAVKPEKGPADAKPLKKIKTIEDLMKLDKHGKRHLELVKMGFCNPEDVSETFLKRPFNKPSSNSHEMSKRKRRGSSTLPRLLRN